jgi:hypothetical protein
MGPPGDPFNPMTQINPSKPVQVWIQPAQTQSGLVRVTS